MQRSEVFRFKIPQGLGREQHGARYGIVVQADEFLPRSVVIFSCNRCGVLRIADRHRPSSSAGIQPAAATART